MVSISDGAAVSGALSAEDCDHFTEGNVSKLDYFGFSVEESGAI